MSYQTYSALPLDALYDLLSANVKEMLHFFDSQEDNLIAFKTQKKQVEVLLAIIEEKRKEKAIEVLD